MKNNVLFFLDDPDLQLFFLNNYHRFQTFEPVCKKNILAIFS